MTMKKIKIELGFHLFFFLFQTDFELCAGSKLFSTFSLKFRNQFPYFLQINTTGDIKLSYSIIIYFKVTSFFSISLYPSFWFISQFVFLIDLMIDMYTHGFMEVLKVFYFTRTPNNFYIRENILNFNLILHSIV